MIRVFPVADPNTRVPNSFGEPRGARPHDGNDLFAPEGTPLIAVDSGEARSGFDQLGGNVVNVRSSDGFRYYYAHLQAFSDEAGTMLSSPPGPRQVRAGDVVGFLGRTGNAAATDPHLHFGIYQGGVARDPYPELMRAPRVAPRQNIRQPLSPLAVVLIVTAAGAATWAFMNQREAERLLRKVLPI